MFINIVFLNAQNDIDSLAYNLTQNIKQDSLKVVALYDWVTKNISYDHAFRRQKEGDTTLTQEAYNVIKRKKAVCVGFSKLIKALCETQGIESHIVFGIAKGGSRNMEDEGHAWNVVKINENWYLLDATWGSSDRMTAQKYFCSTPSVFAETHLPIDPMWQLLEEPIRFECFVYGRSCYSDENNTFHYRDTIAFWQNLDSLEKNYNQALRTLRFNENDADAIRQLAAYYYQKAYNNFSKYQSIKLDIKVKKRKPENKNDILALLDNAEQHLLKAIGEYEKLKKFAKKHRYTDAHMNIDMMEENRQQLISEREFVVKYF